MVIANTIQVIFYVSRKWAKSIFLIRAIEKLCMQLSDVLIIIAYKERKYISGESLFLQKLGENL